MVFAIGCSAGWLLELIFRRFWSGNNAEHRWVNPGYLRGPWLPVYGLGLLCLYLLSDLASFFAVRGLFSSILLVFAMAAAATAVEYISGVFSKKVLHANLWDYSGEWANFYGLICPKFSLFWGLICAGYYFLLYPYLHGVAVRVVEMPLLVLGVGAYVGVFAVDMVHSLRLMQRVKAYALQMRTHINLDQLKINAREYFKNEGARRSPFSFYGMLNRYMFDKNGYRQEIRRKWGNGK